MKVRTTITLDPNLVALAKQIMAEEHEDDFSGFIATLIRDAWRRREREGVRPLPREQDGTPEFRKYPSERAIALGLPPEGGAMVMNEPANSAPSKALAGFDAQINSAAGEIAAQRAPAEPPIHNSRPARPAPLPKGSKAKS